MIDKEAIILRMQTTEQVSLNAGANMWQRAGAQKPRAAVADFHQRPHGDIGNHPGQGLVERDGFARADDFTEIAFTGAAPVGEIVQMRITGVEGARVVAELVS
jgi:hypothetical protein